MRRSRRPRKVDPTAHDLDEWQQHQYVPGYYTKGRIPPVLRGKRPNVWGWTLVVVGVLALVFALPGLMEFGRLLGVAQQQAFDALLGVSVNVVMGALLTASGIALLRRPRRQR